MSFSLQADNDARVERFLEKIAETKKVYVITNGEEILSTISTVYLRDGGQPIQHDHPDVSEDAEEVPVYPFWSNKAYPTHWLKNFNDDLSDFSVEEISLEKFQDMICQLDEAGIPLGIEWNQKGAGSEILPSSMLERISLPGTDGETESEASLGFIARWAKKLLN